MGHVPPPLPPRVLTLDQQAASLERDVARRGTRLWRLGWRRRSAYHACQRLIVLREHDLYGWHTVSHVGRCARGTNTCCPKPPPKALKPAKPTYADRLDVPAGWRGINLVQTSPVTSPVPDPAGLPPPVWLTSAHRGKDLQHPTKEDP